MSFICGILKNTSLVTCSKEVLALKFQHERNAAYTVRANRLSDVQNGLGLSVEAGI